jgi:hypothetical protein
MGAAGAAEFYIEKGSNRFETISTKMTGQSRWEDPVAKKEHGADRKGERSEDCQVPVATGATDGVLFVGEGDDGVVAGGAEGRVNGADGGTG